MPRKKTNETKEKSMDIAKKQKVKVQTKSKKRKSKHSDDDDNSNDEDFHIDEELINNNEDEIEEQNLKKNLKNSRIDSDNDADGNIDDDDESDDNGGKSRKHKSKKVKKNDNSKVKEANLAKKKHSTTNRKSKESASDTMLITIKPKGNNNGAGAGNSGNDQPIFDQAVNKEDETKMVSLDDIFVPDWATEPNIRDKNGLYSNESGYDPTTLYIPKDGLKGFSPVMQQYWQTKSNHFDKIVVMKVWKFYYIYGRDAFIFHKIVDLKMTISGKWSYVFFHESCLARFAPPVLENGHKLVIVEQMEEHAGQNDVIRREICQILTRGTYIETNPSDYTSKFLMSIYENDKTIGIAYVDTTTHEFHIGEFVDDEYKSNLRTILFKIKPIEVIYIKQNLSKEIIAMVQGVSTKPLLSSLPMNNPSSLVEIFDKMDKIFKERHENDQAGVYPELLKNIKTTVEEEMRGEKAQDDNQIPFYSTLQALNMSIQYLDNVMLSETVVTMGNYLAFDVTIEKCSSLYLDSQTLQNLEILEVNYITLQNEANTLFNYMDKTRSPYGKRLFKKWLSSPLIDVNAINDRLDAVDDLIKNQDIMDYYQDAIGKLPDLERMVNKIYNLTNKQRMSAVYFEDFAINRVHDFLGFLKELKKVDEIIGFFKDYTPRFRSKRLKQLTTFKDINIDELKKKKKTSQKISSSIEGIFPRVSTLIADLENMVYIQDRVPIPAPGINEESDKLRNRIDSVKKELEYILEQWRDYFKEKNINYVSSKHRYELEIPEKLVEGKNKPSGFVITSKRKGYLRFHTSEIEKQLSRLYHLEVEFRSVLIPFTLDYFKKFYQRNSYWLQVISCLAELDCLCSLAKLAVTMNTHSKCRPIAKDSNTQIFDLVGMVHPCVAKNQPDFVPNDVNFEKPVEIFLVTGPNMGGKSTLLRQTCIAIIMAQVGSYIPAKSFIFSPIDRIFSRIGASDRILEGKSTFYVEMEEALQIVKESSKKSLVIMDELGRGTSTYDGVAIAYSVLKYIAENIGCLTLFATHYHLLIEEFNLYSNISNYHMECEFDPQKEEVKFLYKFIKGKASNSYGITVAKMAGLPFEVIDIAKERSEFMNQEKRNISYEKSLAIKFNKLIEALQHIEQNEENNNLIDDMFLNETIHLLEEIH